MDNVVTLIGSSLDPAIVAEVARSLNGEADWLAINIACDIHVGSLEAASAETTARAIVGDRPVDVIAQAAHGRRKKLLLADMDSTMVTTETLDELADFAGIKDQVAAITAHSMNGEIDFPTALRERVAMLKGLPADYLEQTYRAIRLTDGAEALVRTMQAFGAKTMLISGGFTCFTERIGARAGFDASRGNVLEVAGGVLTGRVGEPILDRDSKRAALYEFAAEHGVNLADTMAVGDGANDLAMLMAAGLGVAYHAKPVVAAKATARIEHGDLTALLYMQGYRQADFKVS